MWFHIWDIQKSTIYSAGLEIFVYSFPCCLQASTANMPRETVLFMRFGLDRVLFFFSSFECCVRGRRQLHRFHQVISLNEKQKAPSLSLGGCGRAPTCQHCGFRLPPPVGPFSLVTAPLLLLLLGIWGRKTRSGPAQGFKVNHLQSPFLERHAARSYPGRIRFAFTCMQNLQAQLLM